MPIPNSASKKCAPPTWWRHKLTEWGIPIHRGLGTTGVVGIVKNGTSARAVGLRADMDALPMQEFNTFAPRQQAPRQDARLRP